MVFLAINLHFSRIFPVAAAGLERLSRLDGGLAASDGWTGRGDGDIMGIGFVRCIWVNYNDLTATEPWES